MTSCRRAIAVADLNLIAATHGLPGPDAVPVPWIGGMSRVYPLGDVVLKMPFETPEAIRGLHVDTAMSSLMRGLGVRTPELVAYDTSLAILPVPYAFSRRVRDAVTLERVGKRVDVREGWREAGRQLAIVHAVTNEHDVPFQLRSFRQTPELDPRPWIDELYAEGALGLDHAAWLRSVLDGIAPVIRAGEPVTLCHGDVNAANILVHQDTGEFLALIDWAGAGWLDPAWDFAGVPLAAVSFLLAGHRAVFPLPDDETAEARIFWCQAQMRLHNALKTIQAGGQSKSLDRDIRHLRRFAETARGIGRPGAPGIR